MLDWELVDMGRTIRRATLVSAAAAVLGLLVVAVGWMCATFPRGPSSPCAVERDDR